MSFLRRLFKFRIFKFRATLAEELEDLHTESLRLQQSIGRTRLLQRQWTRWLSIYVLLLYIILNVIYFTFFLSQDNIVRIYSFLTSLLIGVILYGIYRLINWYFRTIVQSKEDRLEVFKDRKKELIEEVKNKETYAVAKTLLEKYGEVVTPEVQPIPVVNGNKDLRQRVSVRPTPPGVNQPVVSVRSPNIGTFETINPQTSANNRPTSGDTQNTVPGKLPRAILPPERTFLGTILDLIVGDGPSKRLICDNRLHERWKYRFRYALICKSCNSHNGMALEEEFEYLSYRCAYCNYFNRASKQKPVFQGNIIAHDSTPTATTQPQSESAIENMELSSSESSTNNDNNAPAEAESNIIHRSIRIETSNDADESTSQSSPKEEIQEHVEELSSKKEN